MAHARPAPRPHQRGGAPRERSSFELKERGSIILTEITPGPQDPQRYPGAEICDSDRWPKSCTSNAIMRRQRQTPRRTHEDERSPDCSAR
jgi:hypothetical protein